MEFETNAPQYSDAVSDETRLSATTRKVTLAPIHDEVSPEKTTEEEIANYHAEPNIANAPNDTEITVSDQSTPATARRTHRTALAAGISTGLLLTVMTVLLVLHRLR